MRDDRKSGLTLLMGTAGFLVVMAFHPVRGNFSIFRNIAVHSLVLAVLPIMFIGAIGLYRRLAAPDQLGLSGFVLYAFATVAAMNAGVASGFLGSYLVEKIDAAESESVTNLWRALFDYNFQVNQAFAMLFMVASSAAILLWSIAILRGRKLGQGLGVYGCVVAAFCIGGILMGYGMTTIHGFGGLVFLSQGVWFFTSGVALSRAQ